MSTNVIVFGDSRDHIHKISTPINCVITDPPYGMDFTSNFANNPDGKSFTEKISGDLSVPNAIELFKSVMKPIIAKMADECEIYIFTAWHVLEWWMPAVKSLDPSIKLKQMLIWSKGYPGLGDLDCNWGCGHEIILYLKKGRRPIPLRRSGIIHVDKLATKLNIHPTEKPVALIRQLVDMSTSPGDFIVDPFSGSGSTSVAAKEAGRNSLAFEIDERYIDKSRARLKIQGLFDD